MNLGAVGASAGPYDPGSAPTSMDTNYVRYGSAEQTVGDQNSGGSFLNSMNATGTTPRPSPRQTPARTPPRSPRPRSPTEEEDDAFNDRRRERRESRRNEEPVGLGFRLSACETSLRDHQNEIAAQRLMIQQLSSEMQKQMAERELHGQRLDAVFRVGGSAL